MQMQNQFKANNRIKKSHILIIGSFFVFIGIIFVSWNYLLKMRDTVYSDMKIAMMDVPMELESTTVGDVPPVENVEKKADNTNYVIDYSKYLGVLEIPKIGLKRGFYNTDSRYNNIQYNVTLVSGSTMPDVENGNTILIAHSGDAYISYFAYLWRLGIGDHAYITYGGRKFDFQIVDIYENAKNGAVTIRRNVEKTTLTMITCTKNNDSTQTIYIAELVG